MLQNSLDGILQEESTKPVFEIAKITNEESQTSNSSPERNAKEKLEKTKQDDLKDNTNEPNNIQNLPEIIPNKISESETDNIGTTLPTISLVGAKKGNNSKKTDDKSTENILHIEITTEKQNTMNQVVDIGPVTVQKCCPVGQIVKENGGCKTSSDEFKPIVYKQNTTHYWEWQNVQVEIKHRDPCKRK